jgi:hypothetical protein
MWFDMTLALSQRDGASCAPRPWTPFGVDKPTTRGRATAARTAHHSLAHGTDWQHDRMQHSGCEIPGVLSGPLAPFGRCSRPEAPRV